MSTPRLLLADDSVTIRKVVELTFADEGIDVVAVSDGEAAMKSFVDRQPDIVLVDVGLPGTNGYHLCEMIKGDEATEHIPVLLLVGSFEPFDQGEAERVGADGFLTKPFNSIRDLVSRVHDLLSSSHTASDQSQAGAIEGSQSHVSESHVTHGGVEAENRWQQAERIDDAAETKAEPQNAAQIPDNGSNDDIELIPTHDVLPAVSSTAETEEFSVFELADLDLEDKGTEEAIPENRSREAEAETSLDEEGESLSVLDESPSIVEDGVAIEGSDHHHQQQTFSDEAPRSDIFSDQEAFAEQDSEFDGSTAETAAEFIEDAHGAEPSAMLEHEDTLFDVPDETITKWEMSDDEAAGETENASHETLEAESPTDDRIAEAARIPDIADIEELYRSSVVDDAVGAAGGFNEQVSFDDDLIETVELPRDFDSPYIHLSPAESSELPEFDWSPDAVVSPSQNPDDDEPSELDHSNWPVLDASHEDVSVSSLPDVSEFGSEQSRDSHFEEAKSGAQPCRDDEAESRSYAADEQTTPEVVAEHGSDGPDDKVAPAEAAHTPEMQEPSPEFIALVAQRVVERLSDVVIREIARDSVPRIAEKLIREALSEDNKG